MNEKKKKKTIVLHWVLVEILTPFKTGQKDPAPFYWTESYLVGWLPPSLLIPTNESNGQRRRSGLRGHGGRHGHG